MTNWKIAHSSAIDKPVELDLTSSATTVYERKDIEQEVVIDPTTKEERTQWVFQEREMTKDEYDELQSPTTKILMQNLSDLVANILELLV